MSERKMVRALFKQRLAAAAEELFGLFERTIAEYEEELCRSKEENERQQKLLDAVWKPGVRLHRADIQQLLVTKEQQEWSPSLDQAPPEPPHITEDHEDPPEPPLTKDQEAPPEPPHINWDQEDQTGHPNIKEEEVELFTPVPVKIEADEEKDVQGCSAAEIEVNVDDWEGETSEPQSGANSSKPHVVSESYNECEPGKKTFSCPFCSKEFQKKGYLKQHMVIHTGEKNYSCSNCDQRFTWHFQLKNHKGVCHRSLKLLQNRPKKNREPAASSSSTEQLQVKEEPRSPKPCQKHTLLDFPKPQDLSRERKRICPVCGKRFGCKSNLNRHLLAHTGQRGFSCSICSKTFTLKQTLKQHMAIHIGEKNFSCTVCGKRFIIRSYLTTHMAVHSGEKRYSCSVCGTRVQRKNNLKRHMLVHTGERNFICSVCGKTFNRKGSLKGHMEVHNGEKKFCCSVCGKTFRQPSTLKGHMAVHLRGPIFSCSVCDQKFAREKQLQRHKCAGRPSSSEFLKNRTELKREEEPGASSSTGQIEIISCFVCDRTFTLKSQLTSHMAVHTGERNFICSICGKAFKHKSNLTSHMVLHTEERNFSCSVCGKTFNRQSTLKAHMAVHTKRPRFSCSMCDRTFAREKTLKRHKCAGPRSSKLHQNHTELNRKAEPGASSSTGQPKIISCFVCGKTFTWKSQLIKHMAVHTGERNFICSVCGKGFTQKSNLTTHMVLHTGKKNFSCSVCGKSFTQKISMTKHMALHTKKSVQSFSCSVCGKTFNLQFLLQRHMAVHAREKIFSCSVCYQNFARDSQLQRHKSAGPCSSQLHENHAEQNREEDYFKKTKKDPRSGLNFLRCENASDGDMQRDIKEKQFSCSECGKVFTYEASLKSHMVVHTGQKRFQCPLCSESFTRKKHLRTHRIAHSERRQFGCEFCDKSFSHESSLKTHTRIHTGEKKFSCSVCDQRFVFQAQVYKHHCAGPQSASQLQLRDTQTEESGERSSTENLNPTIKEEPDWTSAELSFE